MCVFRTLLFLFIAAWLGCSPAFAEKRIALVIGNSAYKNVPRLPNPVNDAALLAAMFGNAGFDAVTTRFDLNVSEMRKILREFGASARDADIAVIFYAGHGIELDGNNYLIPTDAALETDADVLDETLPLDRVLFAVEPAKKLRLIILDACRDNPFTKTMKRTIAARSVGRGLARIEPNNPNTLIAFAAKAGYTASDGNSKNSPFAVALVEHLPKPGLDLRKAFGFVRDDVLKNTGYKQEPYVYGSLGGDDVPIVPAKPVVAASQASAPTDSRRDYELALHLGTRDGWNAFLAQYPDGFYSNLAKGELKKIAAEEARAAAARLLEQEKSRLPGESAKADQEKVAAAATADEAADKSRVDARKAASEEAAAETAPDIAAKQAIDQANSVPSRPTKKAELGTAVDRPAQKRLPAEDNAAELIGGNMHVPLSSVAALPPPQEQPGPPVASLQKLVQLELRRVGCFSAPADGDWNPASQRSLAQFNRFAGTKFDVNLASHDVLDSIKAQAGRVCPLSCLRGFRAEGENCVKITCEKGFFINTDNVCERGRESVANKQSAPHHKSIGPRSRCFVVGGYSYCE
jgi:uncharacterized caspase-like protein